MAAKRPCVKKPKISAELPALALKEKAGLLARQYDPEENNTAWTQAIKDVLFDLAPKYGCEAICTRQEPRCSEFMLDVVWWQRDGKGQRVVLGVESEWGSPWAFKRGNIEAIVNAVDERFLEAVVRQSAS